MRELLSKYFLTSILSVLLMLGGSEVSRAQFSVDSISIVDPILCNGDFGTYAPAISNGVGPYQYTWVDANGVPVGSDSTFTTDTPDTYTVVVVDIGQGASDNANRVVSRPAAVSVIIPPILASDPLCNGDATGSINATITGGAGAPYDFEWVRNGAVVATSEDLVNVIAGGYTLTATDANGCTGSNSYTLNDPPLLTVSATDNDVQCNGDDDGTATALAAGGTEAGTYDYAWTSGDNTATIVGLAPGDYTVTATDDNGCTAQETITITEPDALTVSVTGSDITCNGDDDGSARRASVAGGTTPYSQLWNTGSSANTITGLSGGIYTLTITDNNGCTADDSYNVLEPAVLNVSAALDNNLSCFQSADGGATATPSGGTAPYDYLWTGGESTQSATALSAGLMTVTLTDNNGCQDTDDVLLTEPDELILTVDDTTSVTCNGGADGEIMVTTTGGTGPFDYLWDDGAGQTTEDASGLAAGTYNLDVTDNNGCTASTSADIDEPDPITATLVVTNASCDGDSDGSIEVTNPQGGNGGYTYLWADGGTNSDTTGLAAGFYNVTVTDALGCSQILAETVTQPDALTVTASGTNVTCFGFDDGTATVSGGIVGGTLPYTFQWDNAPLNSTSSGISGLAPGTYTCTVTDFNGCTDSDNYVVTQPDSLITSIDSILNVACNGAATGAVYTSETGGTAPYSYLWTNGGGTAQDATGLSAGNYQLTVTDFNGCTDVADSTITEALPISIVLNTITDVTCNGGSDGAIDVSVSGGSGTLTLLWDDGAATATEDVAGLVAGDYQIVVTDSLGCQDSASYTVAESGAVTGVVAVTDPSCAGVCDGEITVTPSGGDGGGDPDNYTYLWDDPLTQTTQTATGLCDGTFSVTIEDGQGCTGSVINILVEEPTAGSVVVNTTDATCFGLCDGTATAVPAGGTPPYDYLWDDLLTQTTPTATGLCAGLATVTITDANGCQSVGSNTVNAPVAVSASIIGSTDASCFGDCDGDATLGAAGGIPPYDYEWNDPLTQTTPTALNLCAGTYLGTITDRDGCQDTISVTIDEPDAINITFNITHPLCADSLDGSATAIPTGGAGGPWQYTWDDPDTQTTATATDLAQGTYNVTVEDVSGCRASNDTTLVDPPAIDGSTTSSTDPSCATICDGMGSVQATGGNLPYTYSWDFDPLRTDSAYNDLCAGIYDGQIIDNNGCTGDFQFTLTDPPAINFVSSDSVNPTCNAICNGEVEFVANGGVGLITYSWDDPGAQSTSRATGLCDGTYRGTATDGRGCTLTYDITINEPDAIVISLDSIVDATCFEGDDGEIAVTITGGIAPYDLSWDNGGTSDRITNLEAGSYELTVTDDNGCQATETYVVDEGNPITALMNMSTLDCFGDSDGVASVTPAGGGGAPWTYNWDDPSNSTSASVLGLEAGVYNVVVTDSLGCKTTFTDSIQQPDSLQAALQVTSISCNGLTDGQIIAVPQGGTSPYDFDWDIVRDTLNQTSDTLTNLGLNTYAVEIIDDNGCTVQDTADITEPLPLAATITDTLHVVCICSGEAEVTPTGGTAPYSYAWDDLGMQTVQRALNLCAGDYNVTVTDSLGCTYVEPVTIRSAADLEVEIIDSVDVTCNGDLDGQLMAEAAGGVGPYSYSWNDLALTADDTLNNVGIGAYIVQATDFNGCTVQATGNVDGPDAITATFASVQPSCNGDSTGQITVTPVGGNGGPYDVLWDDDDAQATLTATGLPAGSYNVTVTDVAGCQEIINTVLAEPDTILANLSSDTVSCFGLSDASAWAVPSGGVAPYTYLWEDLEITDTITGKAAGTYTVTVTDFNLCSIEDSVTITEPTLLTSSITDTTHVNCSCIGDATVTPVGGVAPYTYLWDDIAAQTTAVATNLCAGTYSVTVTDSVGCTTISTVTINDISGFNATITDTIHNTCFGQSIGQAIATPTGGTPPYTYAWDSSLDTDSTSSGIPAGNYFATVSDDNGCTRNLPFTILEPTEIQINIVENVAIPCFGDSIGEIEASVSGGTAPYTYVWNDLLNQTTLVADSLYAGVFEITVTDDSTCVQTEQYTLAQPTDINASIADFSDISCFGEDDGFIESGFSGGVLPFTYSWSPGSGTSADTNNLTPGTYQVVLTDATGCQDSVQQTIVEPLQLTSSITDTTMVLCNGASTGEAIVTPVGGTAPYTYLWDDPAAQTDSTASNLAAGQYIVVVTDANGCTSSDTIDITQSTPIIITVDNVTGTTCNNCDGSAEISVAGGVAPYTFDWDNGSDSTEAVDLCAISYQVRVTDALGCVVSENIAIPGPNALSANVDSIQNISCFGLEDGIIYASATGGAGGWVYAWDDPLTQNTDDADSLDVGTYTLTVTDADGCTVSNTASITEPDSLDAGIIAVTASDCALPGTGSAQVNQTGGTAPYTYLWNDALMQTTDSATTLIAGNYTVTVTDSLGCTDTANAVVTGPNALMVNLVAQTNVSCNDGSDGSIEVAATGGTAPYTYLWNDALSQNDTLAENLTAGNYTCTVTDANGCTVIYNGTITEPTGINITVDQINNATCFGCDGSAFVTATGGFGTLDYLWEANSNGIQSIGDSATDLCIQAYKVFVTDDNACMDSLQLVVPGPNNFQAVIDSVNQPSCFASGDGEIFARGFGGNPPYSYLWRDTLVMDSVLLNLNDGSYTLDVTDSDGCVASATRNISSPFILNAIIVDSTASDCSPAANGTARLLVTGGTTPYDILWNDDANQTTLTATGLAPRNYVVDVTDANGCTASDSTTIVAPNALFVNLVSQTNNLCNGESNGSIEIEVSGGIAPFTYAWDDPMSQNDTLAEGLSAGTYTCTVTDADGCQVQYVATITEPDAINIAVDQVNNSSCLVCDGSAFVSATGGTGTLNYLWEANSNGVQSTGDSATALCIQSYQVYVSDDNACIDSLDINIPGPNNFAAVIDSIHQPSCDGVMDGAIFGSGINGDLPYSYSWSSGENSDDITGLAAGNYELTVTDNLGCVARVDADIVYPTRLVAEITDTTESACSVPGTGTATAVVNGGTAPYTYLWNDVFAQTTLVATDLVTSNYTFVATDANGCTAADSTVITGPLGLAVTLNSKSNISCHDAGNDGQITVNVNGGTLPYASLNWSDGQSGPVATNLDVGTYTFTLVDDAGCVATYTTDIIRPNAITGSFTDTTMVSCFGLSDASVTYTPAGGTTPYSYQWFDSADNPIGRTDSTASGLAVGSYYVVVTDASGCSVTSDNITITQPEPITVSIGAIRHITCGGVCDATATADVNGGTTPYTYLWTANSNGYQQTTAFADSLCAGSYTVTVNDANGCAPSSTVATINDDGALRIVSMDSTLISCAGADNGTAEVTVTGGVGVPSIDWSNNESTAFIDRLEPGTYVVTVEDLINCIVTDSVIITEPDPLVATIVGQTNLDCFGDCDGSAEVNGTGGTLPYSYAWNDPDGQSDSLAINLCGQGNLVATITDANGCQATANTTIVEPLDFMIFTQQSGEVNCFGEANGSAWTSVMGGTAPLSYEWSSGEIGQVAGALEAGQQFVAITDANGCTDTSFVTIGGPDAPLSVVVNNLTGIRCIGVNDAEIEVGAAGGTLNNPPAFVWDNGAHTGNTYSGLSVGTYGVTVTDDNGCATTDSITIDAADALSASITVGNITCNGARDGSMEVVATGGVAPYSYNWDNGSDQALIEDLAPQTRIVQIIDDNNCQLNLSASVSEPISLSANIIASSNLTCFNSCDGSATVRVTGGTSPYTYAWDPDVNGVIQTGRTGRNFCAQNVDVDIVDANGCTATAEITLTQPDEIELTTDVTAASCSNVNDGNASVTLRGGTGSFTIDWDGPNGFDADEADINNVGVGTYEVEAFDQNGCRVTESIQIEAQIVVEANAGEDQVVCMSDTVMLQGTGGQSYEWTGGLSDSIIYVAPENTTTYVLEVNNQGCIDTDTVSVTVLPQPFADASANTTTVVSGTEVELIGTGATTNGTYLWSPSASLDDSTSANPIASPSETTTYQLVIQDASGCSDTAFVEVIVIPGIIIPSGITPNGDARNETWNIQYIEQFEDPLVEVYNRWGQLVFRSVGYIQQWDGTMNDEPLPAGTYYYVIDLGEGMEPLTGPITIMR